MVNIVYVREKIHYDKSKPCGWDYRELEYRVDYKNKKRKTRFVTYKGYCQWYSFERYNDDAIETISIRSEYRHFPIDKSRFKKKLREGRWDSWDTEYKIKGVDYGI